MAGVGTMSMARTPVEFARYEQAVSASQVRFCEACMMAVNVGEFGCECMQAERDASVAEILSLHHFGRMS